MKLGRLGVWYSTDKLDGSQLRDFVYVDDAADLALVPEHVVAEQIPVDQALAGVRARGEQVECSDERVDLVEAVGGKRLTASRDSEPVDRAGAAVTLKPLVTMLIEAGCDCIVIDTAHGHSQGVIDIVAGELAAKIVNRGIGRVQPLGEALIDIQPVGVALGDDGLPLPLTRDSSSTVIA